MQIVLVQCENGGRRHDTGTEVVTRSTVVSTVVSSALYNRIIFGK